MTTLRRRSHTPSVHDLPQRADTPETHSIYTTHSTSSTHNLPVTSQPPPPPPSPSLALLFSHLTRRDVLVLLIPSVFVSVIGGGIAPFMTQVIAQAFDAFARFPLTPNPPQQAKDTLLRNMAICTIELVALAVGTLVHSSIMATLWMWVGERNILRLRKRVYDAVTSKDMEWFDLKTGLSSSGPEPSSDSTKDSKSKQSDEGAASGAGAMMANFNRDTEDVRMATALNTGMLIQYFVTFITCLILALIRSWSLTLVVLSSIPLLVFVQGVSQALAIPLYNIERNKTSQSGTLIERAVTSISTVKAFNAVRRETNAVSNVIELAKAAYSRCCIIWGATAGLSQFILFAMFVQGFWFGSKLVREGKITPGDVMGVFWACLIASSNLQLCIPLLVVVTKGKAAAVSLEVLITPSPSSSQPRPLSSASEVLPKTPNTPQFNMKLFGNSNRNMTKVIPQGKCHGSINFHQITFAYPSRPNVPVLNFDEVYLPHGETTFIVGGSGSGKSTIAQLLLRMYEAQSGTILFDDQDILHLDPSYTKAHIAAVSQGCILFDMTVHENVAMGFAGSGKKEPKDATREEVQRACQAALMHDFIRDLPDGYDTKLGTSGASLSGGQRQRLAIARAMIRDPTVLILDEATSALDATSRVLVFEAIKMWRRNRTTVVITHDLSQIGSEDFVYVMKAGTIVEQGFRSALEAIPQGEFRSMFNKQTDSGGFPIKDDTDPWTGSDHAHDEEAERILEQQSTDSHALYSEKAKTRKHTSQTWVASRHQSFGAPLMNPPPNMNTWMFEAVADLAGTKSSAAIQQAAATRASTFLTAGPHDMPLVQRNVSGAQFTAGRPSFQDTRRVREAEEEEIVDYRRRKSLQFEPISPPAHLTSWGRKSGSDEDMEDDMEFEREKDAMKASAAVATLKRPNRMESRRDLRGERLRAGGADLSSVKVEDPSMSTANSELPPSLFRIACQFYPTLPNKPLVLFGMIVAVMNGAMTPIFSFLLARLMSEVGAGAQAVSTITFYAMLVLLIALGDGLTGGLKFFVMEHAAMGWVASLRTNAYETILRQDKAWFDDPAHAAEKLVQVLIKDGDDARTLIATVLSQGIVVVTMLGLGLVWAMVKGWQLTFVGIGIAPVFAGCMMVQSVLMEKFELRNKRAREDVAKRYFESVSNVRAIRSMGFEHVFAEQFDESLQVALKTGVRGALVAGTGYGVANGLIYIAQGLIYYVGAVMMARGTYTYLQLLEVVNLVVFSVSIAAQIMTFVPRIAKAKQAAHDLRRMIHITAETSESRGSLRFPIRGDLRFDHVTFAYPQRPDVPVLRDISFTVRDGECVAIVGASGSGKSTLAALIQRLYEPLSGSIKIGRFTLSDSDVTWLRSHIAIVSQNAALFDASVKDNISYGAESESVSFEQVRRAARDAQLDTFIDSLPQGYDTMLGENASLISGGQAQRLQIARALVNGKANIMLFDEATSALDVDNQEAVMSTLMKVKEGRTTVVVTHKLAVMRTCDRILVVDNGTIVEEGAYEVLMAKRGPFFKMLSAGEWSSQ